MFMPRALFGSLWRAMCLIQPPFSLLKGQKPRLSGGDGRQTAWVWGAAALLCLGGAQAALAATEGVGGAQNGGLGAEAALSGPSQAGSAERELPLAVHAVIARRAIVTHQYEISGEIEAAESFTVAFRDGGRVSFIGVEVGDHVAPKQVIARVDPAQADAAVEAAMAEVTAGEASLKRAKLARDRAAALAERGAGTRANLDAAIQMLFAAQATRDQAQVGLDKALQAQRDTVINAGTRGVVTQRLAQIGQIVGPAQPVLRLARDGARDAVFFAPDTFELATALGMQVRVRTLDWPLLEFGAVISEISPLVMEDSGTVRVTARLEDRGPQPALGVAVAGTIEWEGLSVISLPASAMAMTAKGPAVWRVDPKTQRVALVQVTLARHDAMHVEIATGIEEGDVIVTDGSQFLFAGRLIRVLEDQL